MKAKSGKRVSAIGMIILICLLLISTFPFSKSMVSASSVGTLEEQTGWISYGPNTNVINFSQDTGFKKYGVSSLKITSTTRYTSGAWIGVRKTGLSIQSPKSIQFWINSSNGTKLDIKVTSANGTAGQSTLKFKQNSGWEYIELPLESLNLYGPNVTNGTTPYLPDIASIEFTMWSPDMGTSPGTINWSIDALKVQTGLSLEENEAWDTYSGNPNEFTSSIDTTPANVKYGTKSLKMVSAQRQNADVWVGARYDGINVKDPALVKFWLKSDTTSPIDVKVDNGDGTYADFMINPSGNGQWQQYIVPISAMNAWGTRATLGQLPIIDQVQQIEFTLNQTWLGTAPGVKTWWVDNLIVETSYDELSGWVSYGPSTNVFDVSPDTIRVQSGTHSLKLESQIRDTNSDWVGARKQGLSIEHPEYIELWGYFTRSVPIDLKLTDVAGTTSGSYNLNLANTGFQYIKIPISAFNYWGDRVNLGLMPRMPDIGTLEFALYTPNMGSNPGTIQWLIDGLKVITYSDNPAPLSRWLSPTPQISTATTYKLNLDINDIWHSPSHIAPDVVGTQPVIDTVDDIISQWYPASNFEFNFGGVPAREDASTLFTTSRKTVFDWAKTKGVGVWMEGHNLPKGYSYLEDNGMVPIDGAGRTPDQIPGYDMTHAEDTTNPAVLDLIKSKAQLSISDIGGKAYSMVDYVWPSDGGLGWGYSTSAKALWKTILQQLDEGLIIHTPTVNQTVYFWSYFNDYNGFTFTPADLGYTSWSQYDPAVFNDLGTDVKKRNWYVLNMLYHYQWLRAAAEVGKVAQSYGGELNVIPNPEFTQNGTDLTYWAKSANTGMALLEEWANPDVIMNNYLSANYFKKQFTASSKPLGLISETAAAGGDPFAIPPRPHYWDNEANYLINYTLQGIWNFAAHEDEYWGAPFNDEKDPNQQWYSSYAGLKSSLDGTLQAAKDQLVKPTSDILSLTLRGVTGHEYIPFDRGGDGQSYNLAKTLTKKNYLYDQAAFPLGNVDINDYNTILYSPRETPQGYFTNLRNWLNTSGRTLITHSFVPKRQIDGVSIMDTDKTTIYSGVNGDTTLGLGTLTQTAVSSGTISNIAAGFAPYLNMNIGDAVTLEKPLLQITNGTPLVKLGSYNLVTEVAVGSGKIIYLNFVPVENSLDLNSNEGRLNKLIMEAVMKYIGKVPYAEDTDEAFGIMKFNKPGATVFSILSWAGALEPKPFTAKNIKLTGSVNVVLSPNTTYTSKDILTGQMTTVISDSQGKIAIDMNGFGLRVVEYSRMDQNNGTASFTNAHDIGGNKVRLQTFKPSSSTLSRMDLWTYKKDKPVGDLEIKIVELDSSNNPTTVLYKGTFSNVSVSTTAGLLTFYPNLTGLNPTQNYGIVISSAGSTASTTTNVYGFAYNDSSVYTTGIERVSSNGGTSWTTENNRSLKFVSYR